MAPPPAPHVEQAVIYAPPPAAPTAVTVTIFSVDPATLTAMPSLHSTITTDSSAYYALLAATPAQASLALPVSLTTLSHPTISASSNASSPIPAIKKSHYYPSQALFHSCYG